MDSWQCDLCGREFPSYEHIYDLEHEDRDELINALPQVSFGNQKDVLYSCRSCNNQIFLSGMELLSYDKCFEVSLENGAPKITILSKRSGGTF